MKAFTCLLVLLHFLKEYEFSSIGIDSQYMVTITLDQSNQYLNFTISYLFKVESKVAIEFGSSTTNLDMIVSEYYKEGTVIKQFIDDYALQDLKLAKDTTLGGHNDVKDVSIRSSPIDFTFTRRLVTDDPESLDKAIKPQDEPYIFAISYAKKSGTDFNYSDFSNRKQFKLYFCPNKNFFLAEIDDYKYYCQSPAPTNLEATKQSGFIFLIFGLGSLIFIPFAFTYILKSSSKLINKQQP